MHERIQVRILQLDPGSWILDPGPLAGLFILPCPAFFSAGLFSAGLFSTGFFHAFFFSLSVRLSRHPGGRRFLSFACTWMQDPGSHSTTGSWVPGSWAHSGLVACLCTTPPVLNLKCLPAFAPSHVRLSRHPGGRGQHVDPGSASNPPVLLGGDLCILLIVNC